MSIVVTNEITIPARRAEEVAAKFAANSKGLDAFDGYEGFTVCAPTQPADDRWLVITRWRDEEAYEAWRASKKFDRDHAKPGSHQAEPKQSAVRHYNVVFTTM